MINLIIFDQNSRMIPRIFILLSLLITCHSDIRGQSSITIQNYFEDFYFGFTELSFYASDNDTAFTTLAPIVGQKLVVGVDSCKLGVLKDFLLNHTSTSMHNNCEDSIFLYQIGLVDYYKVVFIGATENEVWAGEKEDNGITHYENLISFLQAFGHTLRMKDSLVEIYFDAIEEAH